MFCQKCGTENKDDAAFCNKCGADLRLVIVFPEQPLKDQKSNDFILLKIQTLKEQKKGHVGPVILVIIGLVLVFANFSFSGESHNLEWIFGRILMTIAIFWDAWRIYKNKKLDDEIKEWLERME